MGTVTFFNPEHDRPIPQETDLLYLPGGYPENRLEELAGARLARESIRSYIEAGGRTLAECGGMIYLSQSVLSDGDTDGGSAGSCVGNIGNEMVGVLPFSITNERKRRKLTLGYRRFDYNGWRLKGHEFHYTQFAVPETDGKEGAAESGRILHYEPFFHRMRIYFEGKRLMKVLIIGPLGAGKSSLAYAINRKFNLSLIHI